MSVDVGRLALRQEGEWWKAYYAKPHTMEGALLIGTLAIRLAEDDDVKHAFIDLMKGAVTVLTKNATGLELEWPNDPQPAPEHERSGRA